MDTRPDLSAVCPRLIGRVGSLDLLTHLMGQARQGRGRTGLVSGEAGIGKSRLIAEARAHIAGPVPARARDPILVLQGACFEPDRACPYAPILDLLRGYVADRPPDRLADALGPAAGEIVKLLPELAFTDVAPTPRLAPEQEKRRLFHALVQFLLRLAADRPLLVVTEDLHWSDDTSLEFFLTFARRLTTQRVFLLLTYRSDEIHPGLRHFLAELDRERLCTEIALPGLSRAEVDAMLHAILRPERPRPEFVDAVFALTDGNPFFIEEVLKSLGAQIADLVAGAWETLPLADLQIPRSVQDAVHRRSARLSRLAHNVLALAAVIGRRFDLALLHALTKRDDARLLPAVKELVGAQLIVEVAPGQFAFRHALTRQAILTDLLATERQPLHRTILETIEQLDDPAREAHLPDLAYHAREAGDWPKALTYAVRAAEQAHALDAPRAAIEHCTRALDAARHLAHPPPASVYRWRGLAHATLGGFERARADLTEALRMAQEAGDRRAEWQALLDLGLLWTGRDYHAAGEMLRSAVDLARSFPDRIPYAQSLNRLGNWHANTGHIDETIPLHRQALDLFQASGDRHGTAETLDLLGMANGLAGDLRASVDYYDRAIALFREIGDRRGLLASLAGRIVWKFAWHFGETIVSPSSDLDAMRADTDEAIALARALDWPAMEAFVHIGAGPNLEMYGAIGEGMIHLREALRIATEIGHQQWIAATRLHFSRVYRLLLHAELAVRVAEEGLAGARALGSVFWTEVGTSYLALAHLLDQYPDRAEATLTTIPRPTEPPRSLAERLLAWTWGELALAHGDATTALEIAEALLASIPGGPSDQPIPGPLTLKGEALLMLDRPEQAVDALADAKRWAVERHELTIRWQIQGSFARALEAAGRPDEAAREATEAHALVATLAASVDDEPLRQHFGRAAHASLPGAPAVGPRQPTELTFDGLTTREREVALLLARRLSNREIAEVLFVGERTVETHVANILAKLGCASRTQVATWLVDHDIIERQV